MNGNSFFQIAIALLLILLAIKPLGWYIARVFTRRIPWMEPAMNRLERIVSRICNVDLHAEMNWQEYARSLLIFSMMSALLLYLLQRFQAYFPGNPESLGAVSPDSSFNTSVSFVTNTNWQGYAGEATMSYFTQMVGLTVQNFLSAAVGLAVLVAMVRGFERASSETIGNFWNDTIRALVAILLPLSLVFSLIMASQGVVQTLSPYQEVALVEGVVTPEGNSLNSQKIAVGPVASQIAIKQLGTNGGGFFNANSAHPFENPTPLANLLQMVAILLIPASLCYSFGEMIGDRRQGWAILAAMFAIFLPMLAVVLFDEFQPNPAFASLSLDMRSGNMEGKEVRIGVANSALWAVATTAASNGSVNAMHDSMMPLSGLVTLWLMQIGEVVFGGVGSGLYGMLVFAIVAVFLAGLMVGRTPEYLGKKIGAFEVKMASLVILLPCAMVLIGTALGVICEEGRKGVANAGPHGFSEILYAFSSTSNNNGSAFAGLSANTPFYNGLLGLTMLLGRFGVILPVLAIAGSLAKKKRVPSGAGTMPTHTPLFVCMLVAVIVVVGALSFFPALALGPIVEHLMMTH